jgi:hypothetical protein
LADQEKSDFLRKIGAKDETLAQLSTAQLSTIAESYAKAYKAYFLSILLMMVLSNFYKILINRRFLKIIWFLLSF